MEEGALIFHRISFFRGRGFPTCRLLQISWIGWVFFIPVEFLCSLNKKKITSRNHNGDIGEVVFDHLLKRSFELLCGIVNPLNQKFGTLFGGL